MDDVDPWVEEVRVALALNGGISLAVWMGGCAVELDRARRTRCDSAPNAAANAGPRPPVYSALCDAFRRELVVDVMSGSSAGGINGALLAGAIANGRELLPEFLRNRWLDLGDFSSLLQPLSVGDPTAVMQGHYFAGELKLTFDELLDNQPETTLPPLIPALDVTATDTTGRPLEFRDAWSDKLYAREYRARFRFRHKDDFNAVSLSAAARASASFPLAFDPYAAPDARTQALAQITPDSWLVDGGLLDNAPIKAALSLIPPRPATRQVRRFLCYVNGDPKGLTRARDTPPSTRDVIGIVVNLPRKALVADHLIALQGVARRSPIGHQALVSLLAVELSALRATATALLPAYRRRRRLRVLQDLLPEPGDAQRAFDAIEGAAPLELPWLPASLDTTAHHWPWGFEAARRVHHLAIDLVRAALPRASPEQRRALLVVRSAIDTRLQELEDERGELDVTSRARTQLEMIAAGGDPAQLLEPLVALTKKAGERLAPGIEATARDLIGVLTALDATPDGRVGRGLFGDSRSEEKMLAAFRARVVAIEVVRRSFLDEEPVDDGQEIVFAQLTPQAPSPIFTARPFTEPYPVSADRKLCGTVLGHFGGFYRRSWRANDFLWGRLDASARIVEMLVSTIRANALKTTDDVQPWVRLAAELNEIAVASEQHRKLLEEALADLDEALDGKTPLRSRLLVVLEKDLRRGDGSRTRVLCTRAVQFEILCEELQHLVVEAANDLADGSNPSTMGIEGRAVRDPEDVFCALRELRNARQSLPEALGRNRQELTSDLGVRTVAHAGLVALGVARQAAGPIGTPLTALRSLLLPLAGAVSHDLFNRLGVAAAFAAAALYLGARSASTESSETVDLEKLSASGLLLAIVALLVVAGTVLLPLIRAWAGGSTGRRAVQAAIGVLLLVSGVGGIACAWWFGEPTLTDLVFAPGVTPPWYVTLLALMLGAGAATGAPKPVQRIVKKLGMPAWCGRPSLLLTFLAALIVAAWTYGSLRDALGSDQGWRQWTATFAIAALPVALLVVLANARRLAPPAPDPTDANALIGRTRSSRA